ncbi:hypothetical protein ACP70R_001695 [Stipagrostis hirtigluma subsp. patula]
MAAQFQPMIVPTDAELLEAQADLWRHSLCYLTSMALKCAVELGIPTAIHRLGGATTLPNLITELSLPPAKLPFLRRLMRLLATSGVFATDNSSEEGSVYRLSPLSCLLVDGVVIDGNAHQKAIVLATNSRHYVEAASSLAAWFKKDTAVSPFEELHGAALFEESMARLDPESDKIFREALAAHDNLGISVVLQQCPDMFKGLQSLTDCCGGDGTTAKAIVKAFPHIRCTVLDLPRVINATTAHSAINYVAGDMFKFIPPAQAVLLKLVLHFWNDEDCVKILSQCKKAIPSREEGGKVIIIDIVIGSTSKAMLETELLVDMLMLAVTNGQQRDENEWRKIFTKAGFSGYKIVKKVGPRGDGI